MYCATLYLLFIEMMPGQIRWKSIEMMPGQIGQIRHHLNGFPPNSTTQFDRFDQAYLNGFPPNLTSN